MRRLPLAGLLAVRGGEDRDHVLPVLGEEQRGGLRDGLRLVRVAVGGPERVRDAPVGGDCHDPRDEHAKHVHGAVRADFGEPHAYAPAFSSVPALTYTS